MKHLEPEKPSNSLGDEGQKAASLSQEELIDKVQTTHLSGTIPQSQTKPDRTQAELWDAVRTVSRLKLQVKIIGHQAEPEYYPPLIAIQSGGNKKPLFMVPGIVREGEEATKLFLGFARIARYLDKEQPFYVLKPWGLDGEQNPHTFVEAIAADYVKAIRDFQPEGPYLLGGECLGGIVAFEMAQQFKAQGQKVELLALLDTWCPTDAETLLSYKPQLYSDRIVLLATEERCHQNPALGWSDVATGGLEIYTIPGNHRNYIREHAQAIGEQLRAWLDGNCALPAPNQPSQESEETFAASQNELELQLTKIWEEVLGIHPIGVRDNFFDLGGNSLVAVSLFAEIKKKFGKNLPLATLFQEPTIEKLSNILRQSEWSTPWFSLVPIQPGGSKPPLFGIHSLGKGQEHYRNIARHLGSDQPVYGLDYWLATQTKDTKELPKTWSVEELAAHYIKEMQILQPEGPYFLAGSSFAGIVAYEMAQQLVTQGQKVALLVLFDTYCPTLSVNSLDFNSFQIHLRNLSQLEMKEKLAYIMMKVNYKIQHYLRWVKPFFQKVAEKFYLKFKLPMPYALHYSLIVEANKKLSGDYALQVYPGKVTLFRASDQAVRYEQFSDLGWSALAVGGLEIHEVPGDHMGMFQEPHVQMLAEKLSACIDRMQVDDLAHIPSPCADPFDGDNNEDAEG